VEFLSWPWRDVEVFLLLLVRVGMVLFLFPFFGSRLIPVQCKAGFCLLLTVLFFPVISLGDTRMPSSAAGIFWLILSELTVGMMLGFLVQLFFEAVNMMGQLAGFQTGFSITNIIDPQNGIQISVLSNMASLVALSLFLALDGHHLFLRAIQESYEIVPVGGLALKEEPLRELIGRAGEMFVLSIKMGAPVLVGLLFMQAALGLLSKAIPQMNVMIVAFPLQIVLGLFLFGISLKVVLRLTEKYLTGLGPLLMNTMAWMKG
jgi:flagellar biosynthetic protein FliR